MAGARDKNGRYVKGPGRKKGSKNRIPKDARQMVRDLMEASFPLVLADMEKLEPYHRARVFVQLLPYVLPRMQQVSADVDISRLSDAEVDSLYFRLLHSLKPENGHHE